MEMRPHPGMVPKNQDGIITKRRLNKAMGKVNRPMCLKHLEHLTQTGSDFNLGFGPFEGSQSFHRHATLKEGGARGGDAALLLV